MHDDIMGLFIPAEIWVHVIQFVTHDCPRICGERAQREPYPVVGIPTIACDEAKLARSTLWALSLTGKTLHRLATPSLYRSITPDVRMLPCLLRTMISNPELGLATRSLGLYNQHDFLPSFSPRSRLQNPTPAWIQLTGNLASERWMFELAAKEVGISYSGLTEIAARDPWKWALMLLFYCPNIQHLDIATGAWSQQSCSSKVNTFFGLCFSDDRDGKLTRQAFPSLKSITRRSVRPPQTEHVEGADPFVFLMLNVPKLKDLSIRSTFFDSTSLNVDGSTFTTAHRQGRLSAIENLALENCFFDASALREILQRTPRLRILKIVVDSGRHIDPHNPGNQSRFTADPNSLNDFADVLYLVKNTLEELTVLADNTTSYMFQSGWIGNLRRFSKLRKLKIDNHFWSLPANRPETSADHLPDRLEHLSIQMDRQADVEGYIGLSLSDDPDEDGFYSEEHIQGTTDVLYDGAYEKAVDALKLPTFRYPSH
ncbi:hypothetical protein BJ508DRAFT_9008 [Ascobolus immersus RN42]|uniref:Uncharacterized protein n=1 Tax=Ascobolus immersus RN42 TaxID=1160509 RepID=A0A3N4HRB8_ASCIM|nr:hypothetical protein BJ508DRAFT_9008 [Ascobolus immersus RN42]